MISGQTAGLVVLAVANVVAFNINLYFSGKNAENARENVVRHYEDQILDDSEVDDLRCAVSDWAYKYAEANPTGKYLKRREADLFRVCSEEIGLTWLRPRNRPKWKDEMKA